MKKLLLTLLAVIAVFIITPVGLTSCTKTVVENHDTTIIIHHDTTIIAGDTGSNSNSPYYIKGTINGVDFKYNYTTGAINPAVGLMKIYGKNSYDVNADGVNINMQNTDAQSVWLPITVGTYSDSNLSGISSLGFLISQGGKTYANVYKINKQPFILKITAIDSATVSGTYSGIVSYGSPYSAYDSSAVVSKVITNGSFYVPF